MPDHLDHPEHPDHSDALAALAAVCAEAEGADALLRDGLPLLATLGGWHAGVVLRPRDGGLETVLRHGADLDPPPGEALAWHRHSGAELVGLRTPGAWAERGVGAVGCHPLPGPPGQHPHLVVAWSGAAPSPSYDVGVTLLRGSLAALDTGERLADLQARVDNAQLLATMGDYDWHVASDTNEWSDQLYRIYGHEPQSFNASYERFLSFIHPDDRAMVTEVHRRAYETGEPYEMVERIVRADGELRYLASNGQVLHDEEGRPVRFRGTCIDITDRVRAEQETARSRRFFERLVEVSPEAVLVADPDDRVVQANRGAVRLLGGDPVGRPLRQLVPLDGPEALGLRTTGLDGRAVTIDVRRVNLGEIDDGGRRMTAAFLHDATARLQREALAASLREAQVRRRQALEINDNVVQGLTASVYAQESGDALGSLDLQRRTLGAARRMMSDLLDPLDGADLQPGDLVRSVAAEPSADPAPPAGAVPSQPAGAAGPDSAGRADGADGADARRRRVLIVDDNADVRLLLRTRLELDGRLDVAGEAGDGEEGVRLARETRPDVVVLDLAMPGMDGLQALPLLREAVPSAQVVVLSGFQDAVMAQRALAAGAARYVEKGVALSDLTRVLEELAAPADA